MQIETPNLKLPLRVAGHVQVQRSIREGFEKIDAAVAALQGSGGGSGAAPTAADIAVTPSNGYSGTTVQGIIDEMSADIADLKTRVAALEAANSPA